MSVLDTLANATARTKRVQIVMDAAVRDEWEAATAALDAAVQEDAKHGSLSASKPATTAAVDNLEALRDRMLASQVTFEFDRIDWTEHIALQAAHPPIPGNPIHASRGHNIETFTGALIRASCVRVIGTDGDESPEIPESTWQTLLGAPGRPARGEEPAVPAVPGKLNLGSVNKLAQAALDANEGDALVPPSARSLLGSQDSGASLAQPSPGMSRPDASEDGNRPTSPKSSATKKATQKRAKSAGS